MMIRSNKGRRYGAALFLAPLGTASAANLQPTQVCSLVARMYAAGTF